MQRHQRTLPVIRWHDGYIVGAGKTHCKRNIHDNLQQRLTQYGFHVEPLTPSLPLSTYFSSFYYVTLHRLAQHDSQKQQRREGERTINTTTACCLVEKETMRAETFPQIREPVGKISEISCQ
jgi:hypothetical protein